jgi:hypothetical protein
VSKKPQVLTKASELRLLGKAVTAAEELGLIGIIESVGPSLSTIEKLGLLSKAGAGNFTGHLAMCPNVNLCPAPLQAPLS